MSYNYLKGLLRWSLLLVPVGSLAYTNRHFYFPYFYRCLEYDQAPLSEHSKKYVQEHDLITPHIAPDHPKRNEHDHFFEKSILHKMNGLDIYSIFLDKNFYRMLTNQSGMTSEQIEQIKENAKLTCVFNTNSRVQGHLGIVHGGFTSTLFDNLAGSLAFFVSDFHPAKTAYLNVTYKKPLKVGKEYIIEMEVDRIEDKDIYLKGKVLDDSDNVCTIVNTKFIKMPALNFASTEIEREIQTERKAYDIIKLLPFKLFKRRQQQENSSEKTQEKTSS